MYAGCWFDSNCMYFWTSFTLRKSEQQAGWHWSGCAKLPDLGLVWCSCWLEWSCTFIEDDWRGFSWFFRHSLSSLLLATCLCCRWRGRKEQMWISVCIHAKTDVRSGRIIIDRETNWTWKISLQVLNALILEHASFFFKKSRHKSFSMLTDLQQYEFMT